jgi:hypothetical protein
VGDFISAGLCVLTWLLVNWPKEVQKALARMSSGEGRGRARGRWEGREGDGRGEREGHAPCSPLRQPLLTPSSALAHPFVSPCSPLRQPLLTPSSACPACPASSPLPSAQEDEEAERAHVDGEPDDWCVACVWPWACAWAWAQHPAAATPGHVLVRVRVRVPAWPSSLAAPTCALDSPRGTTSCCRTRIALINASHAILNNTHYYSLDLLPPRHDFLLPHLHHRTLTSDQPAPGPGDAEAGGATDPFSEALLGPANAQVRLAGVCMVVHVCVYVYGRALVRVHRRTQGCAVSRVCPWPGPPRPSWRRARTPLARPSSPARDSAAPEPRSKLASARGEGGEGGGTERAPLRRAARPPAARGRAARGRGRCHASPWAVRRAVRARLAACGRLGGCQLLRRGNGLEQMHGVERRLGDAGQAGCVRGSRVRA